MERAELETKTHSDRVQSGPPASSDCCGLGLGGPPPPHSASAAQALYIPSGHKHRNEKDYMFIEEQSVDMFALQAVSLLITNNRDMSVVSN